MIALMLHSVKWPKLGTMFGPHDGIGPSRRLIEFQVDLKSPTHKPEFNQEKFTAHPAGGEWLAAKVAMDMRLTPVLNTTGCVAALTRAGGALEL